MNPVHAALALLALVTEGTISEAFNNGNDAVVLPTPGTEILYPSIVAEFLQTKIASEITRPLRNVFQCFGFFSMVLYIKSRRDEAFNPPGFGAAANSIEENERVRSLVYVPVQNNNTVNSTPNSTKTIKSASARLLFY